MFAVKDWWTSCMLMAQTSSKISPVSLVVAKSVVRWYRFASRIKCICCLFIAGSVSHKRLAWHFKFDTKRFSTAQLRTFTRFAFSWGIWIMHWPLDWGRSCASALRGWCQSRQQTQSTNRVQNRYWLGFDGPRWTDAFEQRMLPLLILLRRWKA